MSKILKFLLKALLICLVLLVASWVVGVIFFEAAGFAAFSTELLGAIYHAVGFWGIVGLTAGIGYVCFPEDGAAAIVEAGEIAGQVFTAALDAVDTATGGTFSILKWALIIIGGLLLYNKVMGDDEEPDPEQSPTPAALDYGGAV